MSSPATHEQSVLAIASTHPLLRARDLAASGIPTITLTRMVKSGKLARVIRGVYSLPGSSMSEHRSLAEAALHVSSGVVCLLSALRVHEIGTQAPHEVWLAIEHQAPIPRLDRPTIHIVRMSGAARTEGVEVHVIDGVNVPVFCAAKTVADCFMPGPNEKLRSTLSCTLPPSTAFPMSYVPTLKAWSRDQKSGRIDPCTSEAACRRT